MRDRRLLLIDFIGPAVGDVTTSGLLVFMRSSMMPVCRMKFGKARLHQLRRDEAIRRVDQKPLRIGAEWLDIVPVFMFICVGDQTPHSYESVCVTRLSRVRCSGLRGIGDGIHAASPKVL